VAEYDPTSREKRVHQRTHGRMPFVTMVKTISSMWKELPPDERKKYQDLAAVDNQRYYHQKEHMVSLKKAKTRKIANSKTTSVAEMAMAQ